MRLRWKALLGIGLLSLLTVGLAGCSGINQRSEGVKGKKELVVATPGDMYASSFHDPKTHKLTGYEVDIAKEVGKRLHRKVVFKELNVDGELTAVSTGKADVAAGNFSLSHQLYHHRYLFSKPYKYSYGGLLVRSGDQSGIHSWSDLKGKRSAGEAGTAYQKFAQYIGAKLVNYDNASGLINDVANGKVDFIPNDYNGLSMNVKKTPVKGVTMAKGLYYRTNLMGSGIGFLINKKDTKLQSELNRTINSMRKDGTLSKIMLKYYSHDVSKKPSNIHVKYFKIPSSVKGN